MVNRRAQTVLIAVANRIYRGIICNNITKDEKNREADLSDLDDVRVRPVLHEILQRRDLRMRVLVDAVNVRHIHNQIRVDFLESVVAVDTYSGSSSSSSSSSERNKNKNKNIVRGTFFLLDGVFLPCDHGLDYVRFQSIKLLYFCLFLFWTT